MAVRLSALRAGCPLPSRNILLLFKNNCIPCMIMSNEISQNLPRGNYRLYIKGYSDHALLIMKFVIYILYIMNVRMTDINTVLLSYQKNWLTHLETMSEIRILRLLLHYKQRVKGKKNDVKCERKNFNQCNRSRQRA
jgi:hypothetical protein